MEEMGRDLGNVDTRADLQFRLWKIFFLLLKMKVKSISIIILYLIK